LRMGVASPLDSARRDSIERDAVISRQVRRVQFRTLHSRRLDHSGHAG
jgi:hypothetical protein